MVKPLAEGVLADYLLEVEHDRGKVEEALSASPGGGAPGKPS